MHFQNVCIEAISYTLPPQVVTSEEIEGELATVYERLGLQVGRLELMTGIAQRRFFEPGTRPGAVSALTAQKAIDASQLDRAKIGCLIHGSVCRDQLEPATASSVHHLTGLPDTALVLDVSNACLGLLDGMLLLANMIELGQVRAGVIVGTEDGRDLVEGTIQSLLNDTGITRQSIKSAIASLTIGAGSAAIVLCDRKLSKTGNRFLGGAFRSETSCYELCEGGSSAEDHGDDRPRMETDAEAMLQAGVALAELAWQDTKRALNWTNNDVDKAFTHQVGKAHRRLLYERLELDSAIDFPTVEFLGNTGAVALPMTAAIGIERGHVRPGDRVAMLGIGSGLNALMFGIEWGSL